MENYFRDALNNFIFEEAGGGAIRHLADRGYTARQIANSLSFPIPYGKVREALTEHLLETGVLLREKPGTGIKQEKAEYVREYDKYGKASFRKVIVMERGEQADRPAAKKTWEEMEFEKFLLLYRRAAEGIKLMAVTELAKAEKNIYITCEFGGERTKEMLEVLEPAQQEYIRGICFTRKPMYHFLDRRMFGIAVKLQEKELPVGKVYLRR